MISSPCNSPEEFSGWASLRAISQMWSTVIVKAQVAFQRGLQEPDVREEPAAKLDAPELAEDGALQPFHEAIRPRMAGASPRMPHPERGADLIEGAPVFIALIGEDPLHAPPRRPIGGEDPRGQEPGGRGARELGQTAAIAYEHAASQAVYCQTLPTPLSLPM